MSRILTSIMFSVAIVFAFWSAEPSYAQQVINPQTVKPKIPKVGPSSDLDLFGSATIMSDNRSQGFTSTREGAGISGDLGLIYKNFYLGVSISNVDFGKTIDFNGNPKGVADLEISYFAGYVNVWRDIDYDIGISYSTFPGAFDPLGEFDSFEISAGVAKVIVSDLKGGLRIYYSPEASGKTGQNWVFEGTLEKPLGTFIRGWKPTMTASLGYQEGDEGDGGFDYWFWNVGVEIYLNKTFSVDLRYHDTADVPFSCAGACDEAFVASATLEF